MDNCLAVIRERVKPLTFKTWFEPVRAMKLESSVLTLQVPSSFFYEWIEEHYNPLLTQSIQQAIGPDARIDYLSSKRMESPFPLQVRFAGERRLRGRFLRALASITASSILPHGIFRNRREERRRSMNTSSTVPRT